MNAPPVCVVTVVMVNPEPAQTVLTGTALTAKSRAYEAGGAQRPAASCRMR
ncbi:hypothetical protein [Streptomyces albicerus]|uniref:hypothetical protein n=1 Tax=Streptomyces albicerus TaxID=2569859 RepID=UPI001788BBFD|nr:hypothetical protein [Streptomyces albicerus]